MKRPIRRLLVLPALFAALVVAACNKANDEAAPDQGQGPPQGGNRGGPPGKSTPIHEVMVKLAKGPQSLTPMIGRELASDPPPWDQLRTQTKEYAELASSIGQYDPPRGSKESWKKLTDAYTESALALDRSVGQKDKEGALAAHKAINNSCMGCHREHRPGKGGPGGAGGFGPPGKGGFKPPDQ